MAAVEGAGSPIVRLASGHKAGEEGSEMRETGGLEPLAFWSRRRRWEMGNYVLCVGAMQWVVLWPGEERNDRRWVNTSGGRKKMVEPAEEKTKKTWGAAPLGKKDGFRRDKAREEIYAEMKIVNMNDESLVENRKRA
ncbi:hypothetical protein NC653_035971 [Populus alba x Populus x berolinensis]|uniref:Uncharacterized protein n=1 Tax=Populus alba x Populus x berolinensis TaxID=444605 RepID=A0AAD6PUC1_9ROSI|nr:hypothetical protein NC653_035971 [Populus alba x Populus x berolinensis]